MSVCVPVPVRVCVCVCVCVCNRVAGWQKTLQRASAAGRKDKGEEKFSQEVRRGEQILEEHNLKIGF